MGDEVGDTYPYAKFYYDRIRGFCSLSRPVSARGGANKVNRLVFFWFFRQPTAKTPAPIFTINTSNDIVWRKDVPFGGPENKILHFDPIFPKKRKFLANFRWKISRQKGLNNGDARE